MEKPQVDAHPRWTSTEIGRALAQLRWNPPADEDQEGGDDD